MASRQQHANPCRTKSSQSCDQCRARKHRCDNASPVCSRCTKFQLECTYTRQQRKRGPPKGTRSTVHERLRSLEQLARQLGVDPKQRDQLGSLVASLTAAPDFLDVKPELEAEADIPFANFLQGEPPSPFISKDAFFGAPSIFEDMPWSTAASVAPSDSDMTATFASMYCPTDSSESPGSVDLLLPSLASCSPEDILADLDLSLSLSTLEPSLPAGSGPTTDLVLSHLPSPPLLQNLVDLYAFHVHPFLPMADLPALRHALISPPWPFPIDFALLLHSIYALGWCFVGRSEADGARESADNFAKCKELLERLQGKHTLRSLQGLANMCLYTAQSSGIGLEVADMYLAQAICAARHLGVDRRPLLTDLDPSTRDRVHSFWSLFLLDKYMAVNKTRLPMISEDEAEYMQQYPLTHDLLVPLHIAFSLCHTMQLRPPADPSSYITRIRRTLEQARPYLTQPDQLRVCRNVLYCVAAVRSGFEPGDVVARYLGPAMRDAVQCADSSGYVTLGSPFANFGVLFLLKLGLRLGIATEPDLCAGAAALSGHGVRWRTSAGLVRDLMGVWMGAKAVEAGVGNGNGPAQLEGTSTSVESSEGEERLVAV